MSNIRNTTSLEFSKLSHWVKENNIEAIKKFISEAKIAHGSYWHPYTNELYIPCAVRDAILLGHIEIVKLFLAEGISPNTHAFNKGNGGYLRTLISFAAEIGNLAIVKLLVEKGAAVSKDKFDNGDDSAIKEAVKNGYLEMTEYLLQQKGVSSNNVIRYGLRELSFLAVAALQNNHKMAEILVKYGAKIPNSIGLAEEKFNDEGRYKKGEDFQKLKDGYSLTIKNLMDYAMGVDFESEEYSHWHFRNLNVSGFNFIGVSIAGRPVTRDMLLAKKIAGADTAIFTLAELKLIEANRSETLKKRLETFIQKRGQLIDKNGIFNLVPLCQAAEVGDIKAVETRLKAGIDPNEKEDEEKETALVRAAEKGHIDMVKLLLAHPKTNIKTIPKAILAAQKNKHTALVVLLESEQDVNQQDAKGDTRLHHAIRDGRVEEVKALVAKGADVNLKGSETYPLHIAARNSYNRKYLRKSSPEHVAIIKILLEAKADPNLTYCENTALDVAASVGSLEAMKLLMPYDKKTTRTEIYVSLDEKAQNYPWYRDMLFDSYYSQDWLSILKLLKSEGADFNCKKNGSILHMVMKDFPSLTDVSSKDSGDKSLASFAKHLSLLDFLLENGADPNLTDEYHGDTPLHVFVENINLNHLKDEYKEIIYRCIKKGFKLEMPNKYGRTLLHAAASEDNYAVVQYLLEIGANINALDENENTPLHLAAAAGRIMTTNLLIVSGAATLSINKDGLTPRAIAERALEQNIKIFSFRTPKEKADFVKPYKQIQAELRAAEPMSFRMQQKTFLFGLFGKGQSSLKPYSGDCLFDRNTVKIVSDFLRPNLSGQK